MVGGQKDGDAFRLGITVTSMSRIAIGGALNLVTIGRKKSLTADVGVPGSLPCASLSGAFLTRSDFGRSLTPHGL